MAHFLVWRPVMQEPQRPAAAQFSERGVRKGFHLE